jgi:hypothetical protein
MPSVQPFRPIICAAPQAAPVSVAIPQLKATDPELLKITTEEMPMYLEKFSSEMLI